MPKRILKGVVISDKADKTLTVKVERRFSDPFFKKTVRSSKKYKTHDENNKFKVSVILFLSSGIVKWEFTDTPVNESLLLIQLALVLIVLPDKSSFPIVNIDTIIQ